MPSNGLHYQGDSKKKTSDILKYNCFAVFEETIRFQSLLAQKKLAGTFCLCFIFYLRKIHISFSESCQDAPLILWYTSTQKRKRNAEFDSQTNPRLVMFKEYCNM